MARRGVTIGNALRIRARGNQGKVVDLFEAVVEECEAINISLDKFKRQQLKGKSLRAIFWEDNFEVNGQLIE